jgi:hypothetical protein
MKLITDRDIHYLVKAANLAGFEVDVNQLELCIWLAGEETHLRQAIPSGWGTVHIFEYVDYYYEDRYYFMVGAIYGSYKTAFPYNSHSPKNKQCTLGASLLNDTEFMTYVKRPGLMNDWIRNKTTRYNIMIPKKLGDNFVDFTKAFFTLKCNPRFT